MKQNLPKSVVLLSSGLDSTVNLFAALKQSEVVLALTFDYGQRAAPREIERSAQLAMRAGVRHQVLALPWFRDFTQTSLINRAADIPVSASVSIDDFTVSTQSAKAVWVPNRNGIFLNIAAAFAEGLHAQWLIPGFNAEEAVTFADNSEAFLDATTHALSFSTSNKVAVKCFTTALTKPQIAQYGRTLGVPFDLIWPCYFGGEKPCGECESCQRFARATQSETA
jgi:7-cyano-7-deazaguanine synthase